MSARDEFLARVRAAVQAGNRAGRTPPIPVRGGVGYQGAGPDSVARFRTECAAAGGIVHVVAGAPAAVAEVLALVRGKGARRVLLGRGAFLDTLELAGHLAGAGIDTAPVSDLPEANRRDTFFAADVGISGVEALVAETGSVVVKARPDEPRSLTLLPPVHIAVASRQQLLPDLFDLFPCEGQAPPALPSCLTLITGPSKTGDIELKLVTGVHGPGELHVVLVEP